jgi:chromate transporter
MAAAGGAEDHRCSVENRRGFDDARRRLNGCMGARACAPEVLRAFLKLGLTSFGGPVAHIGYFREEFVVRRQWLDDAAFSDLVGLCQFLPGPASSQLGFSIGLMRAGFLGGLAAWTGFTLPSAIALMLLAFGADAALQGNSAASSVAMGLVHGLKLVAVAIVAQAVWGMARTLCPDLRRAAIAIVSAVAISVGVSSMMQVAVLLCGGLLGILFCRAPTPASTAPLITPVSDLAPVSRLAAPVPRAVGMTSLAVFALLLFGLPLLHRWHAAALFDAFYRSGALVFGGGHVVLPLLREAFVASGWVSEDVFLAGYGAAQAVPGPLFTFASYLGAVASPASHRAAGALIGLAGIFLPGMLILVGTLPFWDRFRVRADAQAFMRGVNAAVVGLLGAALYHPIWTSSVNTAADIGVALIGFVLLTVWRAPPILIVALGAAAGVVLTRP